MTNVETPSIAYQIVAVSETSEAELGPDVDITIRGLLHDQPGAREATVFEDAFVGFARKQHPIFAGHVTAEAFAFFENLAVTRNYGLGAWVERALQKRGLRQVIGGTVPDFTTALAACVDCNLVGMAPRCLVQALNTLPLRSFPLPFPVAPLTVTLSWDRSLDEDPEHKWLRERILKAGGEL